MSYYSAVSQDHELYKIISYTKFKEGRVISQLHILKGSKTPLVYEMSGVDITILIGERLSF
jgi:hypothetical protein